MSRDLQDDIADLANQLSAMVSARDLTIRDLRAALVEIRDVAMGSKCKWSNWGTANWGTCAERGERELCAYCIAVKVIGHKDDKGRQ